MTNQFLQFVKMHGLGNDFMVIDSFTKKIDLPKDVIKLLSHRHTGVGFDQLLLIEKSEIADFYCRIYNADGSDAEQCGNGMRCVARFLIEEGLTHKRIILIETKTRTILARAHDLDHIEIDMGIPSFEPKDIPFIEEHYKPLYPIDIPSYGTLNMSVVSMGNPHAILFVDHVDQFPVQDIGAFIAKHPLFPQGTNVGFVEIIDDAHIRLRTFERGVGETYACGSNACAAVVEGIITHKLAKTVTVELSLGVLLVTWDGPHTRVIMSGPASRVYAGSMTLPLD